MVSDCFVRLSYDYDTYTVHIPNAIVHISYSANYILIVLNVLFEKYCPYSCKLKYSRVLIFHCNCMA